jgi:hypothetical protein
LPTVVSTKAIKRRKKWMETLPLQLKN